MVTGNAINKLAKEAMRGAFVKGANGPYSTSAVAQHRSAEYMVRVTVKVNRLAHGHNAGDILRAALVGIRDEYRWPADDEGNER